MNRAYNYLLKKFVYYICHPWHTDCISVCDSVTTKWDIAKIISCKEKLLNYAMIILNRPVTFGADDFVQLWNNARLRITVDGGTEQWVNFISELPPKLKETVNLPHLITGDFDSIPKHIFDDFKSKDSKIIHTMDQNHTDFTKSLMEINKHCQHNKIKLDHVITIGQCSGRLDHILGNIHTLFLAKQKKILQSDTRLYILSDNSISWLLEPGKHEIIVPTELKTSEGSWCSLVPIGEECRCVETFGLKWDLDKEPLKFGSRLSTSNGFAGKESVIIKCSHTLLWSMYLQLLPQSRL